MGTKSLFGVKQLLTTFDAADICYVTPNTIKNWIKSGQLKAYCTPGGHYRIRKEDLDRFVQEHQMATKTVGEPKIKPRVLAVAMESDPSLPEILEADNYELMHASSSFEAGIRTIILDPDIILVDSQRSSVEEIEGICRAVKTIDSIKHIPVLVITNDPDFDDRIKVGAADYIVRPFKNEDLTSAVDRWAFKMLA